jgi:hypothetical protein
MIKDYCPGYYETVSGGVVAVRNLEAQPWEEEEEEEEEEGWG